MGCVPASSFAWLLSCGPLAQVVQRLLLDIRQDVVNPSAGLARSVPRSGSPVQPNPQPPVGNRLVRSSCSRQPKASCLTLLGTAAILAASRAACTAGSNSAIRMPMIVMTTRSSTSVKPPPAGRAKVE